MSARPRRRFAVALAALCALCSAASRGAEAMPCVWHVDAAAGHDTNSGVAVAAAFRSLQRACDAVGPGDRVVVRPGVYFERVRLTRAGEPGRPIVFEADAVAKGRVVVSGADPAIRRGEVAWQVEDADLDLYSIPLRHFPVRVLYDGVDLLPYHTPAGLRAFALGDRNPGAPHGFAHDPVANRLYVRLDRTRHVRAGRADAGAAGARGRFGSCDPSRHVMAVGPVPGQGRKGENVALPEHYNWAIDTGGPAHVVLDGFTFETPGLTAVYVRGSDVTVRNGWFVGCKHAVSGEDPGAQGGRTSDRVTVEFCDFSQYPAFDDAMEVIAQFAGDPRYLANKLFWWQRKGQQDNESVPPSHDYETGLAGKIGRQWTIRNNRIHDVFDGLSHKGMDRADGVEIASNRFERVIDDAIEVENHGADLRIHDNEFVDCFVALSWQPMEGLPWPGPVRFFRNLVWNTPATMALRRRAGHGGAWLKAGAIDRQWQTVPNLKDVPMDVVAPAGAGVVVFNNTVVTPDAVFLERSHGGGPGRRIDGFRFFHNLFVLEPRGDGRAIEENVAGRPGFDFRRNLYAPARRAPGFPDATVAGEGGVLLDDPAAVGLVDPSAARFDLAPGSPAIGRGGRVAAEPDASPDLGAIPFGRAWAAPRVGPQPRAP